MRLAWITWHEFHAFCESLNDPTIRFGNPETIAALHRAYSDGAAWLEAPIEAKRAGGPRPISEANYIIVWAWMRQICVGTEREIETRRIALLEYLRYYRGSAVPVVAWARHFTLINDAELEAVNYFYKPDVARSIVRSLAILAFVAAKPFKQLTKEDFSRSVHLNVKKSFYSKTVTDIRLHLDYGTEPGRRAHRSIWDDLKGDPIFGRVSSDFYIHLVRIGASHEHILKTGPILQSLFAYLHTHGLTDCSTFRYEDFLEMTDILKQAGIKTCKYQTLQHKLQILRDFFEWGCGSAFFPSELDYPQQEWLRILRAAQAEQGQGEGWAFASHDIVEQLVRAIVADTPTTDIDILCRCFWLIAASSPPRFSFILNLEAGEALKPMPNQPKARGLYSADADKGRNCYGQFPVLDRLGIEAIEELEERARRLHLKPIKNPRNGRTYVHLFGLPTYPWIVHKGRLNNYLTRMKERIEAREPDGSLVRGGAHSFRAYLLTYIVSKTGSIIAAQFAAGHRDDQMTRLYFRSTLSQTMLLHRLHEKFERGEMTGRFFRQLVDLLVGGETPIDEVLRALTTEMSDEEWLAMYGTRVEMGYCLNQEGCTCWGYCWSCHYFLMRREEAEEAFHFLARQFAHLVHMKRASRNFNLENPLVSGQVRTIALMTQHLKNLNYTEDQIHAKVMHYLYTLPVDTKEDRS